MMRKTIVELQSFGLQRINDRTEVREVGAGPAEGGTIIVEGIPVSVPARSSYISTSPYTIKGANRRYMLSKNNREISPIYMVPKPKFYDIVSTDGIQYNKIALLHGKDCLATTVFQKCKYWDANKRCKFCGVELSLESKATIETKTRMQLAEVVKVAEMLDGIKHILLTSGVATSLRYSLRYIGNCVRAIKKVSVLPIHVQIMPPSDPEELLELKEAGVDTVGIHIESFDFNVLSKIAPAKAELGFERYAKAWKSAVEIFGVNQVSSFLIVGIGESKNSIIDGSEYLAARGVYPFVVPLRPIPGSIMQDVLPPSPELMIELYEAVSEIIVKYKLSSEKNKAGCVRCGACSALRGFEIWNT